MVRLSLSAIAAMTAFVCFGMDAKAEDAAQPVKSAKVKDPKLQKHLLDNIDIFGKSDLPPIYILVPGEEEIQGAILTRDFSRDPFFMQNVDREEFELKVTLRDFSVFKEFEKKEEKKH